MTTKEDFTADEWESVRLLPVMVLSASVLADGRKLVTSLSETVAATGALKEASANLPDNELVQAIAADLDSQSNPGVNLGSGGSVEEVVAELGNKIQAGVDVARAKATPEEFDGLRTVLIATAQAAVERKGSGPLGFGGEKVDANEQAFLDRLNAMLTT